MISGDALCFSRQTLVQSIKYPHLREADSFLMLAKTGHKVRKKNARLHDNPILCFAGKVNLSPVNEIFLVSERARTYACRILS